MTQAVDFSKKPKLLILTTGLRKGGAETALFNNILQIKDSYNLSIISLSLGGYFLEKLKNQNINVTCFDHRSILLFFPNLIKLIYFVIKEKPALIQTWMYHADFVSILIKPFTKAKIIWGIRNGSPNLKINGFKTHFIIVINSIFSKIVPNKIVYCSIKSKELHEDFGFYKRVGKYIPNGISLKKNKLKIIDKKPNDIFKIGNVSRWHPHKDHRSLIEALSIIKNMGVNVKLILVGKNLDNKNSELIEIINFYDLINNVELLGEQYDVDSIYRKLDLFVLSSINEGFPNVLLEAINNKILSISTNVGDSNLLLTENQLIPPNNSKLLAEKIKNFLQIDPLSRSLIIEENFSNILKNYSIEAISNQYSDLYNSFLTCAE